MLMEKFAVAQNPEWRSLWVGASQGFIRRNGVAPTVLTGYLDELHMQMRLGDYLGFNMDPWDPKENEDGDGHDGSGDGSAGRADGGLLVGDGGADGDPIFKNFQRLDNSECRPAGCRPNEFLTGLNSTAGTAQSRGER